MLAVIDVGSSSVRLLIGELDGKKVVACRQEVTSTRLAEKLSEAKSLQPQAIERTVVCLLSYQEIISHYPVKRVLVFGTQALREASNSQELIQIVKEKTGWGIEVISSLREAELTYLGVAGDFELAGRGAIIDIGGGSVEVIYFSGGEKTITSYRLGAVYLTEMFLKSDPPLPAETELLCSYVKQSIKVYQTDMLIGVGGTMTTLAAVCQKLEIYQSDRIQHYVLTEKALANTIKEFLSCSLEERKKIKGLLPERADIIVAGALVFDTLMKMLKISEIFISDENLMQGVIRNYFSKKLTSSSSL